MSFILAQEWRYYTSRMSAEIEEPVFLTTGSLVVRIWGTLTSHAELKIS